MKSSTTGIPRNKDGTFVKGFESPNKRGEWRICICGVKFWAFRFKIKQGKGKFCSYKCMGIARVGKHYSSETEFKYKNGNTSLYMQLKNKYHREYKEWRESVFQRDKYTCQNCKTKGGYLHPHHIKRFIQYPKLRFKLSNGMTLCRSCHRKIELNLQQV